MIWRWDIYTFCSYPLCSSFGENLVSWPQLPPWRLRENVSSFCCIVFSQRKRMLPALLTRTIALFSGIQVCWNSYLSMTKCVAFQPASRPRGFMGASLISTSPDPSRLDLDDLWCEVEMCSLLWTPVHPLIPENQNWETGKLCNPAKLWASVCELSRA